MNGATPVMLGTVCVFPTPEPPPCPDGQSRSDDCSCQTAEIKPNGQPRPGPMGNTQGIIVPDTAPNPHGNSAPEIEATQEEKGWWSRWGSAATHLALDVVGLIPVVGEVADGANALIYLAEGDVTNAALSAAAMIPGAGVAATTAKIGKKAAKEAAERAAKEAAEKAAKEAAEKAAKEAAEKAAAEAAGKGAREAAEGAAGQGAKKADGKGGGKDQAKGKLKCGDAGSYGKMQQKTGGGKFDRDHIPSKAALKTRAENLKGKKLTPAEEKAIDKAGDTIAIPREAHKDVSPTYGQKPEQAARDAEDLAGSAKRDIDAMLDKIDEYDADGGCKEAYKKGAGQILKKSNADFDKWLADVMKNAGKK